MVEVWGKEVMNWFEKEQVKRGSYLTVKTEGRYVLFRFKSKS